MLEMDDYYAPEQQGSGGKNGGIVRKRILGSLLALVLTAGIVLISAAPANASHTACPTAVCGWESSSFSGSPSYYWSNPPNGCTNIGAAWNDKFRSVKTNIGSTVTFYTDANCGGQNVVTVSSWTSVGKYNNCSNSIKDGTSYWNQSASGCTVIPNNRRISSFWYGP